MGVIFGHLPQPRKAGKGRRATHRRARHKGWESLELLETRFGVSAIIFGLAATFGLGYL